MKYLAVIIGGGLGSLLRYLMSVFLQVDTTTKWPWPTFLANILASLLLGVFIGYFLKAEASDSWMLFWVVGFCGGFSTFSTFSKEALLMYQYGHIYLALAYVLASVMSGVLMIFLGIKIMEL